MLLLKELPTSGSLQKFVSRYPDLDIHAVSDFVNILRAASDISDALDKLLNEHNLLQGRWWVLVLLLREDTFVSSPTDLAKKAGVTKATMTGFIDGLEREGLITRFTHEDDGRKLMVKLTSAGLRKLDEVMPAYYRKVKAFMQVLAASKRDALVADLKVLASSIDLLK